MAEVYMSFGGYYGARSSETSALDMYVDAIVLLKRIYGSANAHLIAPFTKLSQVYYGGKDINLAMNYIDTAIQISESLLTPNHFLSANCYGLKGKIFHSSEEHDIAIRYYTKTIKILENLYGKNSKHIHIWYSNIAGAYKRKKDLLTAQNFSRKAANTAPPEDWIFHHNLADLLLATNNSSPKYSEALIALKKAEKITEEYPNNKRRSLHYKLYKQFANCYKGLLNYPSALKYAKKSQNALEGLESQNHKQKIRLSNLISEIYIKLGETEKAQKELDKCLKRYKKTGPIKEEVKTYKLLAELYLRTKEHNKAIASYKESFAIAYDRGSNPDFSDYLNLLLKLDQKEHYKDIIEYSVKEKNADLTKQIRDNIKEKREENLRNKKYNLKQQRQKEIQQGNSIQVEKIEKQIEGIEDNLNQLNNIKPKEDIVFSEIKNILTTNECVVDIMKYTDSAKVEKYIAWIIKPSAKNPIAVDIGPADKLEKEWFKEYWYFSQLKLKDNISYNRYWKNISEQLNDVTKVYFCSDGIYHSINPNILYNVNTKEYVLDEKEIAFISSLNNLKKTENFEIQSSDTIFLIGNPKFTLTIEDGVIDQLATKIQNINTERDWGQLDGTEQEITTIERMLNKNKRIIKKYTGKDANEINLKSITSPKYLHIATHGFFHEDESDKYATNSGLVFSGANNTNKQEKVNGYGDGYFTANEVWELDLSGTELVVLSACNTANGRITNNEGIKGLQSAFKIAGAQNLIMSHWSVSDQRTKIFMEKLYKHILSGKSLSKSFIQTQKELRKKYVYPKYWGAFVLVE
ncbi:CHAT domain-containing protein [Flavobacteriales bacterium]|nr:CHAT domain-containing protein [Flavobacteriales bacterium]